MSQISNAAVAEAAPRAEARAFNAASVLRIAALLAVFCGAAVYESAHLTAFNASETWVHLRTGTWMLKHRAIPRTGLFSQYPNLRWDDASWGFDLLSGIAYRFFGLRSIPMLLMGLKTALAVLIFLLAQRAGASFWKALALSVIAQCVIWPLLALPYVFSIFLFALELQWLIKSRHSGSLRRLWWLPVMFLLWANLHIQFVAGLVLLAGFLVALLIENGLRALKVTWLSPRIVSLPVRQVAFISLLSLVATVVTPYGWCPLANAFQSLYSDVGFAHFSEMDALSFKRPQEYALMLLVMAAFMAMGRRRSVEVFELLTLLAAIALGFRIQRDSWIMAVVAILVLAFAANNAEEELQDTRAPRWQWGTVAWGSVAALTAVVLAIAAADLPRPDFLMSKVSRIYPVKACDYMATHHMPAPLFHAYSWGSFLTWYAPQYPVVVDNRVELYGDKILSEYFDVVGGKERLDAHPMVAHARTLLLENDSAMAKALINLPGLKSAYKLVYSDEIASIFVPVNQSQKP